jgi:hypothetical protein
MSSRRLRIGSACLVYLLVMAAWAYGDTRETPLSLAIGLTALVGVVAVNLATGYIVGFWAIALAVAPVLFALPAGSGSRDVPALVPALYTYMPFAAGLLAGGASIRAIRIRRRAKHRPGRGGPGARWHRLMRKPQTEHLATAAAYVAVMCALTYWVFAAQPAVPTVALALLAAAAASFLVGYLVGFAVIPLALLPALVSLLASVHPIEEALSLLLTVVPLAAGLIAAGAFARRAARQDRTETQLPGAAT